MIDWIVFIPTCFVLNLAFGPNNLLAMTHGAQTGVGFALRASVGRLLAFAPMIAISALGLGVILTTSALIFNAVKVIGAAYLIWLGISLWRKAGEATDAHVTLSKATATSAFRAELFSALTNPKAILIFAAFFPQFADITAYWTSYAMLGAAFLALEVMAVLAYAVAGRFAIGLTGQRISLMQRTSGATMCLFGALLLLSPAPKGG